MTATQAGYNGAFTATANAACGTNVTVSPASSTTGSFTITAVTPVLSTAGCSVTIQGATGTTAVAVGASVPAPGGVVLSWVANAAIATQPAPINPLAGPINLIGTTSTFGAVLVVSESNFVGTFTTPVLSGGCGANITSPLPTTAQGPIAGPPQNSTTQRAYYSVVAASGPVAAGACTITVQDSQASPSTGTIGVTVTTSSGGIQ